MVHGPGCIAANTLLSPDTCTTCGGVSTKEHCPLASPPDGDACETPAEPTGMTAIAITIRKAVKQRDIYGSYKLGPRLGRLGTLSWRVSLGLRHNRFRARSYGNHHRGHSGFPILQLVPQIMHPRLVSYSDVVVAGPTRFNLPGRLLGGLCSAWERE